MTLSGLAVSLCKGVVCFGELNTLTWMYSITLYIRITRQVHISEGTKNVNINDVARGPNWQESPY